MIDLVMVFTMGLLTAGLVLLVSISFTVGQTKKAPEPIADAPTEMLRRA